MKSLEKHYNYWKAAAYKMTRGSDTYLDLVHQCIEFASDQQKFEALCKSGDIRHYVTRMMAVQYFSKQSQFNKLYAPPFEGLKDKHVKDIDTTWNGARITTEQLHIVISRLPEPSRSLVELYIESNLTMEQLAKEIGLERNYVLNTINNALKKIRNHVHGKGRS